MTEKLYDENAYLSEFTAKVISCEQTKQGYDLILNRTAFFPEGGGQAADIGEIDGAYVSDVKISDGIITHIVDRAFDVGKEVRGKIDFSVRFSKMQGHTGEHILSGIAHSLFGCENVGFHLGKDEETLDYDIFLDSAQISELEEKANRAVFENRIVTCRYPDADELTSMKYRSKKELSGAIRIVEIEGIDRCACCAPHVGRTGEVGMIIICDSMKYKGGTRLFIKCGDRALKYISDAKKDLYAISHLLSAKPDKCPDAVKRLFDENAENKLKLHNLRVAMTDMRIAEAKPSDGSIIYFDELWESGDMRRFVTECMPRCDKLCAAFCGNDISGYTFVCGSGEKDMTELAANLRQCGAKCGGNPSMITGTLKANKEEIIKLLSI